jgi:hypothetical protein
MGKPTATVYWTLVVQRPAWHFYQRGFAMRYAFSGSRARWRHDRGAGSGMSSSSTFAADSRGSVTLALKRTPSDGRVSLAGRCPPKLDGIWRERTGLPRCSIG